MAKSLRLSGILYDKARAWPQVLPNGSTGKTVKTMDKSDEPLFSRALAVAEVATKYKPDAREVQIYFDLLKRYDINHVTAAIVAHLRDPERGQWYPKPADIIRQIERIKALEVVAASCAIEHAKIDGKKITSEQIRNFRREQL